VARPPDAGGARATAPHSFDHPRALPIIATMAAARAEEVQTPPVPLRRVGALFVPYRMRLAWLLTLIFVSAALGIVSPFLLRAVLDNAYPHHDTTLLTELVLGMIAISVLSGVIGVAQTWASNVVGQKVMHDLRASVYAHLQRMSLAFFTRTRTGEVQSSRPSSRW
jgi:ATP-binding cassette subfamily B protein